jgi:DNA-binding transcriptional LysR family regulator
MQQEMRYIYAIYEEGSFSKAAEKLFLSQPALSMAVQRVEDALGDSVFDRSKRPLQLTPSGKAYIQKYYEISQLEKELQEQINDISNLKGGSLIIGGTQYILSYILAPVLLQYTSLYPDIDVQLIEYSSNQLDNKLQDGSIDMCLKCETVKSPLRAYGHAFSDNLFLAMPKSYIEKYDLPHIGLSRDAVVSGAFHSENYETLPPAYWGRIPLLLLSSGNNLNTRTMELFRENNVMPNVLLEIQQLVTAYHLAINGLGATFTTEFIISKNLDLDMVYFKLDSPLTIREFQFIMNKKGYISKAARKFMEMTKVYYNNV